jgi:hypothetical protein
MNSATRGVGCSEGVYEDFTNLWSWIAEPYFPVPYSSTRNFDLHCHVMLVVSVICLPAQNLLQKHTFTIMAIDLSNVQICMLKSKL